MHCRSFVRAMSRLSVESPRKEQVIRKAFSYDVMMKKKMWVVLQVFQKKYSFEVYNVTEQYEILLVGGSCNLKCHVTFILGTRSGRIQLVIQCILVLYAPIYWNPWINIPVFINNCMMTSWHKIIFRVTGPLWGEYTGDRWIPLTKGQ